MDIDRYDVSEVSDNLRGSDTVMVGESGLTGRWDVPVSLLPDMGGAPTRGSFAWKV